MKNVCLTVRGPVIAQKDLSEIDDSLQLLSCNRFCPSLVYGIKVRTEKVRFFLRNEIILTPFSDVSLFFDA